MSWFLIKRKPGFSGKIFWTLEIPFKTGFTVLETSSYEGQLTRYSIFAGSSKKCWN
jgi:hypothetical protein